MRATRSAALAVLTVVLGCGAREGTSPQPRPGALRGRPLTQAELPTTNGRLYVRNLAAKLASAEALALAAPGNPDTHRRIAELRYRTARYSGRIEGIASAEAELDEAVRLAPGQGDLYLARARVRLTLHRFDAAREDLETAAAAGADDAALLRLRSAIELAVGRFHLRSAAIQEAAEARPTPANLAALADLELQRGQPEAAMVAFEAAEDHIESPDAMFVAWLEVQRGRALLPRDAGAALAFFEDAVARLPGYIAAEEHRAEALAELGRDSEAIAAYQAAARSSGDPEFMGALAELRERRGEHELADQWRSRATARYDILLELYPEAMAWHAASYFLGPGGDVPRARDLLWFNVQLRPTAPAIARFGHAALTALGNRVWGGQSPGHGSDGTSVSGAPAIVWTGFGLGDEQELQQRDSSGRYGPRDDAQRRLASETSLPHTKGHSSTQ